MKKHVYKTSKGFNKALRTIFDDDSGEFDNFAGIAWDGHVLVNEERCRELGYSPCCVMRHEIGHDLLDSGKIALSVPDDPELVAEFRRRHPENAPPEWAKDKQEEWLHHEIAATAIEIAACPCGAHRDEYPVLAAFGDALF